MESDVGVLGFGPQSAEWAVVGEAPGYNEFKQGRPFVGASGQLLRDSLAKVGLDPDRGFYTNVVKTYLDGNPTPTPKQIKAERPALALELKGLPNLKAVLLVGNVPLLAATGHGGITKNRGMVKATHADFPLPLPLFATIHPAAVLRNSNYQHSFVKDLAAFRLLVDPPENTDRFVRITKTNWGQFVAVAARAERGAIDIETTIDEEGEHYRSGVGLVSVAITFDGETAYTFAMTKHPEGDWEADDWATKMCFSSVWDMPLTMHNGYFDRLRLRLLGWNTVLQHDTMAMAYLLNPDERKGLEFLSSMLLGEAPYKGVDYKRVLEEPMDKILEMNGKDALRTWRLRGTLFEKLNEEPALSRVYQFLLMPALNAAIEITEAGVPIDSGRLAALRKGLEAEATSLKASLLVEDAETLNPNSSQQLARLWFEAWGLPVLRRTKTGAPSTDSDTRKLLTLQMPSGPRRKHIEDTDRYKKVSKRLSAYVNSWPRYMDERGRVHPTYKLLHVVTGRTSSSDPNIQNVPHEDEYRRVFGGVEGWSWVKADLSQIELRMAAFVSRDARLLEAYRDGEDLHRLTAKLVLGDDSDAARYRAKTLNFGLLYGAGPNKLREIALFEYDVRFTETEAKRHHQNFFQAYPGLRTWHRNQIARMHQEGRSVSPLGRVRYLPDLYSTDDGLRMKAEREGINHPIQSMASDILLLTVGQVHPHLDPAEARVIAMVHDEIDLLVRNESVEGVVELVKEALENPPLEKYFGIRLDVPLQAEVTKGTHWA